MKKYEFVLNEQEERDLDVALTLYTASLREEVKKHESSINDLNNWIKRNEDIISYILSVKHPEVKNDL